jgi:hypothetical protein
MTRPRRLYTDQKGNFYYIINKKKVFIKVPKGASQKQVQKVNVKTIVNLPETKRIKRRKKRVKAKFQSIPQKSLSQFLQKQTEGGLPYYIFKERKEFPTLEEISKGIKKEPERVVKTEPPVFTAMKTEPVPPSKFSEMKPEPKIKKERETIDLTKSTPSKIFGFANPFAKNRVVPEPEISLNIQPTLVTNFEPYIQFMKSTNRKTYTKGLIKVFRDNDLPAPEKGDPEYASFKANLKKALKDFNRKGDDDEITGGGVDDGLYNDEIEKMIKKRIKDYVPVIPADKTDDLLKYVKRGDKRFGAIVNTSDSSSDGTGKNGNDLGHWTAVYINNEDSYPSIEYHDSLVDGDIPDRLYNSLRKIARKMNPEMYFKFKPNMIRRQDFKKSSCGFHAMKFLDDRYNGVPFHEASGYDDFIEQHKGADNSKDGEQDVDEYKKKYSNYI